MAYQENAEDQLVRERQANAGYRGGNHLTPTYRLTVAGRDITPAIDARLISLTAEESFLKNQIRTWLKWAVQLPPAQLALNPELAVQRAWAHFFAGDTKQTMEIITGLTMIHGHGSAPNLSSKVEGALLGLQATLAGLGGAPETGLLARKV